MYEYLDLMSEVDRFFQGGEQALRASDSVWEQREHASQSTSSLRFDLQGEKKMRKVCRFYTSVILRKDSELRQREYYGSLLTSIPLF